MDKIDFKKKLKHLYAPASTEFSLVDVPEMQFLMIDGHGDPNTAASYTEAVEALYAVAYKIKFASKKEMDRDYGVPPLEGLWWAEDMETFSTNRDKSQWDWTMMIMQPDWITIDVFGDSVAEVQRKKDLPALPIIRLERYHESTAVQILHIGSYDDEGPVLQDMHTKFIPETGLRMAGKHHEIYLSDPRRVDAAKLKTILRQPVTKA